MRKNILYLVRPLIIVLLAAFALSASAAPDVEQAWTVHCDDQVIDAVDGNGDVWTPAWLADGTAYSPADDNLHNVEFNRLEGDDINHIIDKTANFMTDYGKVGEEGADGCSWKSEGCYAVDGVLYVSVTRHIYGNKTGDADHRQTAQNASIIKSTDGGKTWTRSEKENYELPMFPGRRFATPFFIEYGQNGQASVDNADQYVYAISNNGFWDNGDNQILGRVARSKLPDLKGSDWQYYHGGDGMKDSSWAPLMRQGKLLLNAPGKLSMTGATYIPGLNRYLMINWYYPSGNGVQKSSSRSIWDFYLSPKPWGPWKKIGSKEFHPQGYYNPSIFPKFSSADGRRLYVMTSGDYMDKSQKYTHLTFVPIQIEPATAQTKPATAP